MSTANVSEQYGAFADELSDYDLDTNLRPASDIIEYLKEYASQKPEAAALWCFGLGFILGWKLKPW